MVYLDPGIYQKWYTPNQVYSKNGIPGIRHIRKVGYLKSGTQNIDLQFQGYQVIPVFKDMSHRELSISSYLGTLGYNPLYFFFWWTTFFSGGWKDAKFHGDYNGIIFEFPFCGSFSPRENPYIQGYFWSKKYRYTYIQIYFWYYPHF